MDEATAETGFIIDHEIFRGVIYDPNKVGSLIYRGVWKGKDAVLKLQGLKPEFGEGEIMRNFKAQNQSKLIRTPELYVCMPWNEKKGYGYLITEYIDAQKIFQMPFASSKDMQNFARFYQEYRTSAITHPWAVPETLDSLEFTTAKVNHWRKVSESKGRLLLEDYAPYLIRYYPLAIKYLPGIPMVFSHGHLSANDIYKLNDGSFVVMSNLFWGYQVQWYDLAFNIWACLQHIHNISYAFENMISYVEKWLAVYREIPIVKKDGDFDWKIYVLLLERTIGAILVDLGVNDFYAKEENMKDMHHLINLHQRLFDYLEEKLKSLYPVENVRKMGQ